MIRTRTRDLPDLAETYPQVYDHRRWPDHLVRVGMTVEFARWYIWTDDIISIADLSCGDGAIIDALSAPIKIKGDFVPGYEYQGRIEDTIDQIPDVNLFICSETLEHVDDPDALLAKIRQKTRRLVVTTPYSLHGDNNPEHVWAWDDEAVRKMLVDAGFKVDLHNRLELPAGYYTFQFWGCSRG